MSPRMLCAGIGIRNWSEKVNIAASRVGRIEAKRRIVHKEISGRAHVEKIHDVRFRKIARSADTEAACPRRTEF